MLSIYAQSHPTERTPHGKLNPYPTHQSKQNSNTGVQK